MRLAYTRCSKHEGRPTKLAMERRWRTFKMKQSARLEAAYWELVDWPEKRSVIERKLEHLRRL